MSLPTWFHWSAPVAVYLFALLKGSTPERLVAAMLGATWIYGNILQPHWYGEMLPYELAKDLAEFVAIAGLALRYDRWWLLAAGSAKLLQTATDVAGMLVPLHGWAFGTVMWIWGYLLLAALAAGTWRAGRRGPRQEGAPERSTGAQARHTT
jgi:hypothetical protein